VFSSFWIEHQLWGNAPAGYHLVNVLLHGLAALLLWQLLARLRFGAREDGAQTLLPWVAALVFALHPVTVESVAWISERKNVLSGVLYLAAAHAYLRAIPDEAERPLSTRTYLAALLLFAAALLSKTVTATLPAALLLLTWWRRPLQRRDWLATAPLLVLGIGMGLLTVYVERVYVGAVAQTGLGPIDRLLLAGRIPWFYASKLLLPADLAFIYPRWDPDRGLHWWLFLGATVGLLAALWAGRSRLGRGPLVAVLFFGGTLFPALGFFDVYPFRFSWVADHFQYHAAPGLIALTVAAAAAGLRRLPPRWEQAGPWLVLLAGATLALLSASRASDFHDEETLWRATLVTNPAAAMAHQNLGALLLRRGELEQAHEHLAEANRLRPDDAATLGNLAMVSYGLGRVEEARDGFVRALRVAPDDPELHFNAGILFRALGDQERAFTHYERALELRPRRLDWRVAYAEALLRAERLDEASHQLERVLIQDPDHMPARALQRVVKERS
jgi:tetratricopeptide (TPR) repeat protein